MIKTAIGNNIDCQTLKIKCSEIINESKLIESPYNLDCLIEDKYLVISIDDFGEDNLTKIIDLIRQVINEYQIIDDFLIRSFYDVNKIFFCSNNQTKDNIINDKFETVNNLKYSSFNFSVGFFIFLFGLLSLGTIGTIYYFTRPCVLGNCELITESETSISRLLKNQSQGLDEIKIKNIQLGLIEGINKLKRVPRWSKYYQESNILISEYKNKIDDLDKLLNALVLVNNAQTLTKNLPLSLDEWNRVKSFLNDAIKIINSIKVEELNQFKTEKLISYQNELTTVNNNILQEKKANDLLNQAKDLAVVIDNEAKEVKSLVDLENIGKKWQTSIQKVELISPQTTAYLEKEEILNNYLQKLIKVQNQINQEKNALNIKNKAQEKIKLATESQKNNQWTKAVSLWKEAITLFKKIPSEVLLRKEINKLESNANKQLEIATSELKQAIIREEIKTKLKEICNKEEVMCSFNVSKENIKVFLTDKYLQKIASASAITNLTNNKEEKNQIITHIDQVEKNYQYLSSKYKLPVEIYNPQRQLIMIYNNPF